MLLKKNATVNIWDTRGKATPLHCAASKGHLNCLKLLLQHGADVNAGLTTKSPLHYAVQNLAIECVITLLDAGAIPHSPQVIDHQFPSFPFCFYFFLFIINRYSVKHRFMWQHLWVHQK